MAFFTQVYVDLEQGNDANDGSDLSPYLTIQRAVNDFPVDGALRINITGTVNDMAALDLDAAGTTSALSRPIMFSRWVGKPRPTLNFADAEMFQNDDSVDGMILSGINFTFQGEIPSNAFNINTGNTSTHNQWYDNMIDMDLVTANKEAIHTGQQGKAVGNVVLNANNGIRVYYGGFVANNFVSFKRYALMIQTTGYCMNNFMLALPSTDPQAAIYLQNHSSTFVNNIAYDPTGEFQFVRGVSNKYGLGFIGNYAEGFLDGFVEGDALFHFLKNNTQVDIQNNFVGMDPLWEDQNITGDEILDGANPNDSFLILQNNGMIDAIDMRKWFAVITRDILDQSGLSKSIASIEALSGVKFPTTAKPTVFGNESPAESVNPPYFN